MKKNIIIIFCIVSLALLLFSVVYLFSFNAKKLPDISRVTDKEIILLLSKNKDSNDYMTAHKDFKIQDKIILTKESILAGQNGQNFKEVYQGLDSENNRYMKVDLMNAAGNSGLVAVLDFKMQSTVKAYGIILIKSNG